MPTEVEVLEEIRDAIRDIAQRDVTVSFANGKYVYHVTGRAVSTGGAEAGMGSPATFRVEEFDPGTPPSSSIILVGTRAAPAAVEIPTSLLTTLTTPLTVKDASGQAETYPVTITGEGGELFDGEASVIIDQNFASFVLVPFDGGWSVLSSYGG
jgi:hypothetical protein